MGLPRSPGSALWLRYKPKQDGLLASLLPIGAVQFGAQPLPSGVDGRCCSGSQAGNLLATESAEFKEKKVQVALT